MKRILSILFALTLITCFVHTSTASAATPAPQAKTAITKDADGGYYVETITESPSVSPFSITPYSATAATVDKTKSTSYYNSSNSLCWTYSLTGTFRYITGFSAVCADSRATLLIYNSAYSLYSEKHSHSGSTATGTIKMKYKTIVKGKTISITCSKNGTFS
ncbi:MAG: hypothetical protein HFG34_06295 [Eubacterium sp.]|nr:hypothetical protein [Eubacterium sp.]